MGVEEWGGVGQRGLRLVKYVVARGRAMWCWGMGCMSSNHIVV